MPLQEGQVLLTNVRLSFPKLWQAESVKGDPNAKPRYGCRFMIAKDDIKNKAKLDKEIDRIVKANMKGVRPKSKDIFIIDGDGEDGDESSRGYWLVSANRAESQGRPTVVDRDKSPLAQGDDKPYAGCYVNAVISIYKPKDWGKICSCLEVVQFSKDGERFGAGRVDVNEVLPDLDDEDFDV